MEACRTLEIDKEQFLANGNQLLYNSILSRWFYVPFGSQNIPIKPKLNSYPVGFRLKGKMVYTILSTHDEFEMRTTDAEAILANFYFFPGKEKLKRLLSIPDKPVIVSVDYVFRTSSMILGLAKKLELLGAAGLYAGRKLPIEVLKKICSECSIPIFAASSPDINEISLKFTAGVFAICIQGKSISKEFVSLLHNIYPSKSLVISNCGSERQIYNSVETGSDAIIFRPCIPYNFD